MSETAEHAPRLLAAVGEALAVFIAEDDLPIGSSRRYGLITAGAEANVAAGFVRMGHRASFATVVGADALGDGVVADLRSWGIDVHVRRAEAPTGVLVRGRGSGAPSDAMHIRAGAAAEQLDAGDAKAAWGIGADAVLVTGITLVRSASASNAVHELVARARSEGALVVIDPNLRTRLASAQDFSDALAPLRTLGDIAVGDATELAILAGTSEGEATTSLLKLGYRLVVEKRGADGACASDGRTSVSVPSVAWNLMDTVGAGDAFTAGLLSAVLEGAPLRDALERASRVAAFVVAAPGDVGGLPTRAQALAFGREGR
jgi:2-dehydro-3-deoxygluconokinase